MIYYCFIRYDYKYLFILFIINLFTSNENKLYF
uniref:Uncharacterized protein n=1 Tax=viral metagenome TaxID=1070528 RepID=A0A6C0EDS6_9ZZZZ